MRLYVVGDLHGRRDLFDNLARFVAEDVRHSRPARPFAVFLGDVIDRGPGSASILASLVSGEFPIPFICLRGNHEQMLLDSLQSDAALDAWLRNGGTATLQSYGLDFADYEDIGALRRVMRAAIPQEHLAYLSALPTAAVSGDYFFCHAGVRPDVALDDQQERDLLWIRKPFLQSTRDFGKRVVHGHTPVSEPEILPNRINIDTGAYATGMLTCLLLDKDLLRPVAITALET